MFVTLLNPMLLSIMLLFSAIPIVAQNEVPFTLQDRDRLIKIEERQNPLQKQIDDIKTDINRMEGAMEVQKAELQNLFSGDLASSSAL